MAPLDRLLRRSTPAAGKGTSNVTPDPKPPKGASGRGHSAGFIELEELNTALQHPQGQRVFDKMYRGDGDVRQVVNLSVNPIVGGTWSVIPYGDQEANEKDQEIAEFVTWALWEQMRPNIIGHLIEFLPVLLRGGFAPGETITRGAMYKGEMKLIYDTISLRLPRTIEQWQQDKFGKLVAIKQYLPTSQHDLTARTGAYDFSGSDAQGEGTRNTEIWMKREDLIYYRIGGEGDNWEGTSLLRPAYKHWYLKDKIERIDAIAQEREALGVPICYPPLGATPDQLDEVEDILASMRTNEEGYIVAPGPKAGSGLAAEGTGWLFEVIGYDRSGAGRDPQPSLNYHTQKIAAAFIAEFMRLGQGGNAGARATAQVQADPFLMSIEALATIVEQQLNDDIVVPLVKMNYSGVENFPRLKMSLVDSTSLAQLADFVLKLTQVGALMPDQELEDFLRARADLPPANPESVKKRKDDDKLRREIVSGPPAAEGGGGDTRIGQHDKPGKPHGTKDAAGTNPGARGGTNRGTSESQHSADGPDGVILSYYDENSGRYRPREPRPDELHVDLDALEDTMDAAPQMLLDACAHHLVGDLDVDKLTNDIHTVLAAHYMRGYNSVLAEAAKQRPDLASDPDHLQLSRGARAEGGALQHRAKVAANRVAAEMEFHRSGGHLTGHDPARVQIGAEKAGRAALKAAGHDHAVAAVLHGRHDAGTYLSSADSPYTVTKVRYSAILDRSTCSECRDADDGQARDLDDPVRLHRMPPNPDCHSTHSGQNRCRCFETYEVEPMGFVPQ